MPAGMLNVMEINTIPPPFSLGIIPSSSALSSVCRCYLRLIPMRHLFLPGSKEDSATAFPAVWCQEFVFQFMKTSDPQVQFHWSKPADNFQSC